MNPTTAATHYVRHPQNEQQSRQARTSTSLTIIEGGFLMIICVDFLSYTTTQSMNATAKPSCPPCCIFERVFLFFFFFCLSGNVIVNVNCPKFISSQNFDWRIGQYQLNDHHLTITIFSQDFSANPPRPLNPLIWPFWLFSPFSLLFWPVVLPAFHLYVSL